MARTRRTRLKRSGRKRPARIAPTPETAARRRHDVIARLLARGRIDPHHGHAADEIRRVFEAVGRGMFPTARPTVWTGKVPRYRNWRDFIDRMSMAERRAWEWHYIPWTREMSCQIVAGMPGTRWLQLVLDIVVDNAGLRETERRYELRHGKAIEYLIQGLERYHSRCR